MNDDEAEMLKLWLEQHSPRVQAAARKCPPYGCYRDKLHQNAHYIVTGYSEPHDPSAPAALIVQHGADSFLPGVSTTGIEPERLIPCNCGEWQEPTEAQIEAMKEHFAALNRARALAPKRSTDTQH